jgi:hypothetical protein
LQIAGGGKQLQLIRLIPHNIIIATAKIIKISIGNQTDFTKSLNVISAYVFYQIYKDSQNFNQGQTFSDGIGFILFKVIDIFKYPIKY